MPPSSTGIPSLAEVVQDPARLHGLSAEALGALACQVSALQGAVAAEFTRALAARWAESPVPSDPERYLTAAEAAARLGVTTRWLYRNKKRLPFARPLSRKVLRFSEPGLRRWQQAKRSH